VDPRVGLDDVERRKFLTLPDSNSNPSVVQPVASRYTHYAIPVPLVYEVEFLKMRDRSEKFHYFSIDAVYLR
jgi:hypothetical protein